MLRLLLALALAAPAAILAQTVDHPLDVGGEVKPPVAVSAPLPEWTKAMMKGKEKVGCAAAALIVDEQGVPHDVRLTQSSGSKGYDENIIKAVAAYRFRPASLRAIPVAVRETVQICTNQF